VPTLNEILNETQSVGSGFDVVRRKYIKELSDYTGRNVIIYYSGWLQKPMLPGSHRYYKLMTMTRMVSWRPFTI